MPPLKNNPEIIMAADQAELDMAFHHFRNGRFVYVVAQTIMDGRHKFHLFASPEMDLGDVTVGFLQSEVESQSVYTEYFSDINAYREARHTNDTPSFIEGRGKLASFIGKVLGK